MRLMLIFVFGALSAQDATASMRRMTQGVLGGGARARQNALLHDGVMVMDRPPPFVCVEKVQSTLFRIHVFV